MKTDFKRTLASYTAERGTFHVVDVPPLQYLMIDGHGDPNTAQDYADAITTLFPVAYALKFASKSELDRDYVVMPLEAVWWASNMASFTTSRDKSKWSWTVMIMTPEWIDGSMFERAVSKAGAKKSLAGLDLVRLESLHEGLSVQTLHGGSYDDEAQVLDELHRRVLPDCGLGMTGKHHEIYLSDVRRVEPSKLRTILRQPVEVVDRPRYERANISSL